MKRPGITIEDNEYLRRWEVYVKEWKRRAIALGIALFISIALVIPFLDDHYLHRYFKHGRYLIYVSCAILTLFVGACALTYNFWSYLRRLRNTKDRANPHLK